MRLVTALVLSVIVNKAPSPFPKDNTCDLANDREVAACTQAQVKTWDHSLNAEYQNALVRVSGDQRPLLVEAQGLWVKYRDANCAVEFSHGGTVSGYLGEQCILNMTRDRSKELHGLHDDDTD